MQPRSRRRYRVKPGIWQYLACELLFLAFMALACSLVYILAQLVIYGKVNW
jgi:hypothetical protein